MNRSSKYLNLAFAHGLTLAITLYLAYRLGNWLDVRFGTTPILMGVLVLLVVSANLRLLVRDILAEDQPKKDDEKGAGDELRHR